MRSNASGSDNKSFRMPLKLASACVNCAMIALASCATALSHPPEDEPGTGIDRQRRSPRVVPGNATGEADRDLITSDSFVFIGGWRITNKGAREDGNNSIFDRCGVYVEEADQGKKHVYLCDRVKGNVQKFEAALSEIGTNPDQHASWPLMKPLNIWFGQKIKDREPYAVTRPNADGQLLVSGKTFYATRGFSDPYLSWIDKTLVETPGVPSRQVFGGGFVTIPKGFADKHLDGDDFGVGLGGYRSGQGSASGPSLAVLPRPEEGATEIFGGKVLLAYPWRGGPSEREHRPPDYDRPLFGPPVDNDTGYWQADEVAGGPVWIDDSALHGVCYLSIQGTGDLDYNLQSPTFSNERKIRLYVYDPMDLASVASGELMPHEVRGNIHDWEPPWGWKVDSQAWPGGMFWDGDNLYVAYKHAGAERYDRPPVVAVYKLRD